MTDILCRWLNEEVKLEPKLSDASFAEQSSNGHLFGRVLHKHGLQDDFLQFSEGKSSEAKLNNFMRLEPTFRLLEIPFNINMARDIMTEKPGVATRLMYQLFVALNRKKHRQLTGQTMECMRSSGRVKLEKIESGIFQERLKHQTPRQVDLNFKTLIQKFQERQQQHEEKVTREKLQEEERVQHERKEACHRALEKSQEVRKRQTQMYARLQPISPGKRREREGEGGRRTARTEVAARERTLALAAETKAGIDAFEATLHRAAPPTSLQQQPRSLSTGSIPDHVTPKTTPTQRLATAGPTADYVAQIRKRVQDEAEARKVREKRRRKVLVEQMNALQEQEELKREKLLVERLMRQCQQERRIATQLMHIRKEKDTIRNNRIFRQKQFEQQRMKEFEEALNREAELARQEEGERKARLRHHLELHQRYLSKRAESHYQKNYQLCRGILLQMVDFSAKMAHYRELTQGLVPPKLVRDWKTLFIAGRPLFEDSNGGGEENQSSLDGSFDSSRQAQGDNDQLLDESDFHEYRTAVCNWAPPASIELPRPPNALLSHAVYRLQDMVDPLQPPPTPPNFPHFPLRACCLGKPCSGKSTALQRLAENMGVLVLSVEQLLSKAVETYLSEKRTLEGSGTQEDAPAIEGGNEDHPPAITVEPSSSAKLTPTPRPQVGGEEEEGGDEKGGEETKTAESEGQKDAEPPEHVHFSSLAVLGGRAHSAMASGQPVDNTILVEVIAEELRSLPDGSTWILENFPTTLEQAKLLAAVLTGQSKPLPQLSRDFVLLAERENREEELHAAGGLDLVIHFTASTETVLQRASQQDIAGGVADNKLDQIQHRLLSFDENWPRLRRLYLKFRTLSNVNANNDIESVYTAVENKVVEVVNKAKQADAMKRIGIPQGEITGGSLSSMSMVRMQAKEKVPTVRRRRPSSAGSHGPKTQHQISGMLNHNAEPGGPEWQFCNLPLSKELAQGLAGKWPGIEGTYIGTTKGVFRLLRSEREAICQYFYHRRNEFAEYLKRPDPKQEFVSQWQQNYNALPSYLRCEDVMKAELHHRVDDLCDKLWDIGDHRRSEVEQERSRVVEDQWLEDHIGLLSNHFISLIQVELDKFQDTVLLLKDYYNGMEGKMPTPLPNMGRIPLIELPPTEKQASPASATSSMQSMGQAEGQEKEGGAPAAKGSPKRRVPLLPRQPPTEPVDEKGGKKKGPGPMSPPPPTEDISGLGLDQQLIMHAYNTARTSIFNLITSELKPLDSAIEVASQSARAPPPHQQEKQEEVKEEKGGKGKKDKAAKSPAGKKGKASPAKGAKGAPPPEPPKPQTPAPSVSPEDRAKKQKLLHMWKEHKAAIQHEECSVKLRLELIKGKALELVSSLKAKGKTLHEEMEQWISQCYKQEVDSVSTLAEVLRQAIENEERLLHELSLPGPRFQIQESVMTFVPSSPPPPPSPIEKSLPGKFTVLQLLSLHRQFTAVAPSGFILRNVFVETLTSLTEKALGDDLLPEVWSSLTKEQVEQMCELLYSHAGGYVDWRQFLVGVGLPWPLPTAQQLLDALLKFNSVAPEGSVTREQYMGVRTWLTAGQKPPENEYDKAGKLKEAFFEVFTDPETNTLDYKQMLLYLSADPSPKEGLFKALSVAVGMVVTPQEGSQLDQAILLEDFCKVLLHGVYSDVRMVQGSQVTAVSPAPLVSRESLFEVFVRVSPANPNEVPLRTLLSDPVALEYLDTCRNFSLPNLSAVIRPQSPHEQLETVQLV